VTIILREQLAELSSDLPPASDFSKPHDESDLDPNTPLLQPPTIVLNASSGSRKSLLASEQMTPSLPSFTQHNVCMSVKAYRHQVCNVLRWSWVNPKPRSATPTTSSPSLIGDTSRTMNWSLGAVSIPNWVRRRTFVIALVSYPV